MTGCGLCTTFAPSGQGVGITRYKSNRYVFSSHTCESVHLSVLDSRFRGRGGAGQIEFCTCLCGRRGVYAGSGRSKGPGWVVRAFDYRATCGIFPPCHAEPSRSISDPSARLRVTLGWVGVQGVEGRSRMRGARASRTLLPLAVSRYLCVLLLGLSGIVISINPASRPGCRYAREKWLRFFRFIAVISSARVISPSMTTISCLTCVVTCAVGIASCRGNVRVSQS